MHLRRQDALRSGALLFVLVVTILLVLPGKYNVRSYLPSPISSDSSSQPIIPAQDPALTNTPLPESYRDTLSDLKLPKQLQQYPQLYNRLHAFLSRPVRSYDEATVVNEKKCPRVLSNRLVNPDQLNGDGEFWRDEVSEETIRKKRVEMVNYLVEVIERGEDVVWNVAQLEASDRIQEAGIIADANLDIAKRARISGKDSSRRGFVSAAGNSDTTQRLLTLLRVMRKHYKVDLPFEVWTFPGELPSSSREYIELTEELGATVHEARGLVKDEGAWKNFQIKGLAITSSSFRELIYLDSDNIPLRDPTHLFESARYKNNGAAAFWPDLSKDHVDNAIWRIIGDECDLDHWTFESGQIVIDKAGNDGLNLAALHLAAYMQADHDFWFRMCGGDKDTFRWAFRALDLPFAVSPMWAVPLGQRNGFENGRFCGHTVLQYDLETAPGDEEPQPLFVHSYSEPSLNYVHQWVYQGVARGMCTDLDIWDSEPRLPEEFADYQHVEMQKLSDLPGEPFAGFENIFFDEGGRAGGWRRKRRLD
ncbi:hypothetical protein QFC19_007757 [Naganishia cerealis]|uniref:Uncharacterized protein n=1 Tax=Naganishia cerealis TaxID=610337 RepID=A0ACC2V8C1_9TREE|nr:hypothetical protein QFC19_007757 [Naganishia cerealis]